MEARHIVTEHVTEHTKRSVLEQPESLEQKLRRKEVEEEYRRTHPQHDKPRYRGICCVPANPVFTCTAVEPPCYVHPVVRPGNGGYGLPVQHPMYTTTAASLGQQPAVSDLPMTFHPRTCKFTAINGLGGPYVNAGLNTELDSEPTSG